MSDLHCEIVLWEGERSNVTLDGLASLTDVHPELLERYVEFGLLEPVERRRGVLLFEMSAVVRVKTIQRLRRQTGANLAGVAVILDLVDRLREARHELACLRCLR